MDTRMHRVFGIAEVVQEIVAHLDRRALTNVARVASLFELPASQRLYSSVKERGLRTLASRMLHTSSDPQRDATNRSRCFSHASFIRTIELWLDLFPPSELQWNEVQTAAIMLRQPLFPFPRLRVLNVAMAAPQLVDFVDLLLCPTLEKLKIGITIWSHDMVPAWESRLFAFLERFAQKAERVSNLTLRLHEELEEEWQAELESKLGDVLGAACRNLPLVSLSTENVATTPKLMQSLASIRSLESIRLDMPLYFNRPIDITQYSRTSLVVDGFCSLKEAYLLGNHVIGEVVKSLSGAALQVLSVHILEWGPHMGVLMEAATSFAETLREMKVWERDGYVFPDETYQAYTIPGSTFALLAGCSRMQVFQFVLVNTPKSLIDLHQRHIESVAKAWTMLEELDLTYAPGDAEDIPLTVEAYAAFALHSPALTAITVDPLSPELVVPIPPCPFSHPWKKLTVRLPASLDDPPRSTATSLAHYLDTLWSDIFLVVLGPWEFALSSTPSPGAKMINEALGIIRTTRAMHPGSRWRTQHQGGLMSDTSFDEYDTTWDACPWDIIA